MSSPQIGIDPARLRVIIASVVVGVLVVLGAAAAATAYVSDQREGGSDGEAAAAPSTSDRSSPSAPATPATGATPPLPVPTIPGTDAMGFIGTPARCADGDRPRMMVATAASQSVVCATTGAQLYYAAWRFSTQSGTRVDGVLPAGPGWVAHAADATFNITPTALVISTASGEFTETATGFWAS